MLTVIHITCAQSVLFCIFSLGRNNSLINQFELINYLNRRCTDLNYLSHVRLTATSGVYGVLTLFINADLKALSNRLTITINVTKKQKSYNLRKSDAHVFNDNNDVSRSSPFEHLRNMPMQQYHGTKTRICFNIQ